MTKEQQKRYEELKDMMGRTEFFDDYVLHKVRPEFKLKIEQTVKEEQEYLQKLIDEL